MANYYFAVFMPAVEGGYVVQFPDFPEAFTQGESPEECLNMGAEVLAIAVEEYATARKPAPAPSSLEQIKAWAKKEKGSPGLSDAGEMLFQLFQAPDMDLTPVRISVSLTKNVLDSLDAKAALAGMTRSGFIARSVEAYSQK
jgi:predicted RNase H-like HicB family nuclease